MKDSRKWVSKLRRGDRPQIAAKHTVFPSQFGSKPHPQHANALNFNVVSDSITISHMTKFKVLVTGNTGVVPIDIDVQVSVVEHARNTACHPISSMVHVLFLRMCRSWNSCVCNTLKMHREKMLTVEACSAIDQVARPT